MPWEPGYPKPTDLLEDLRKVYKHEEPSGGEKTARRRRMRKALDADPVTFLQIMSLHQNQYDRRVARYWAKRDREPKRAKVATVDVTSASSESPVAENRAMDVLEGL